MRTTIDAAGRVVIPKSIRDRIGLRAGSTEVVIEIDGAGIRIEPATAEDFEEVDGWLVIPSSGGKLTAEDVRALRDADQE
jgi:AbrB family looped-hinge helix DNA binding protein